MNTSHHSAQQVRSDSPLPAAATPKQATRNGSTELAEVTQQPPHPHIHTRPKALDLSHMFMPYQVERIRDISRYVLDEKARRIGLTYCYAYKYARKRASLPGKTWYTANDSSTVLEFIDYIAYFARFLNSCFEVFDETIVVDETEILTKVVRFRNAGQVHGLSSNPTALHGKGGDVILDEFAYHKQAQTMWEAAQATAAWGDDIVVLSTHTGVDSQFNHLVTQARNLHRAAIEAGTLIRESIADVVRTTEAFHAFALDRRVLPWSYRRTTLQDAVGGGYVEKINREKRTDYKNEDFLRECRAKCLNEDQWKRQYECEPSSDAASLLPYSLILPCVANDCSAPLSDCANILQGGDFARRGHNTSIASGELLGDVLWVRDILRFKDVNWSDQLARISAIARLPQFSHGCYDQTGLGDMPVEELQRTLGRWRIEGVKFTQQSKANLANMLRRRCEDRSIRIPNDQALFDSLTKIRATTTADGRTLFQADDANGEHADDFWSLALLNQAAHSRPEPFAYQPVTLANRPYPRITRGKGLLM